MKCPREGCELDIVFAHQWGVEATWELGVWEWKQVGQHLQRVLVEDDGIWRVGLWLGGDTRTTLICAGGRHQDLRNTGTNELPEEMGDLRRAMEVPEGESKIQRWFIPLQKRAPTRR